MKKFLALLFCLSLLLVSTASADLSEYLESKKCDIPDTFLERWALSVTNDEFSYDNTSVCDYNQGVVIVLSDYSIMAGYGFNTDDLHEYSYPVREIMDAETMTHHPASIDYRFSLLGNLLEYLQSHKAEAIGDLTTRFLHTETDDHSQYDVVVFTKGEKVSYFIVYNVFTNDYRFFNHRVNDND